MEEKKIMKEEKYLAYYDEICVEDKKEVLDICTTASQVINDRFKIPFDDPKLLGVLFSKTFEAIIDELKDAQEKKSSYEINIAKRLSIGYTTTSSEEEEKQGNFMIYIIHHSSGENHSDIIEDKEDKKPKDLCVQWKDANIVDNTQAISRISSKTIDKLRKIEVFIGGDDIVIPLFIAIYDSLITIVKELRLAHKDTLEYELNFLSCFTVIVRENKDGEQEISFEPSIDAKLAIKSDKLATSIHDT